MFGLAGLDIIVVSVYFAGMVGVGVWSYRKIKGTGDFFLGGRKFNKLLTISHAFGTGTHTDQPVSVTGACYEIGLAGIWYQWLWLFCTPFYWLLSPIYRRLRYVTTADFFEQRFGKGLAILYTFMGLIYFMLNIGIMLQGTGRTIEGITAGHLSTNLTIILMTFIFVVYGLAGGIVAAAVTDVFQGFFIVILSFLLFPFIVSKVGGFGALHQGLSAQMFSLVAPREVTLFFIFMVVINGLVGIVVQPHHMAICSSGKTEYDCRTGWCYGNFLKRFCTVAWAFTGVGCAILYPNLAHRELAFGVATRNLLPAGLIGLMLACMLAAVMSTCDAFMVDGSALFVRNFYQKYFKPGASEPHYLTISRYFSVIIVVGGVAIALYIPSVVYGLKLLWNITAFLGIAFWLGVIWRRANRWGALAGCIVPAIIWLIVGDMFKWGLGLPFQWQVAIYLPVGFALAIIVSKLTRPEPEEQLHKFYTLLHTPVGEEDKLRKAGVEMIYEGGKVEPEKKQVGAEPLEERGHSLLIVDLLKLKSKFSFKRYKVDLVGFLITWGVVVAIILLTVFLAHLGG